MLDNSSTTITGQAIIQLENVSVEYRVAQEQIGTFKEYMIRTLEGKVKHRTFNALKDVSLSVNQGEVFGLIGQNGAGKSTLLKLVARVLRPTRGRVIVMGHVAPLLEVGAGFHPELTGRENVFLNGAMLGFSHAEMEEKLPRIVEFSELGGFINAPIRTYSSGMSARLGFAIATDSQPDILIVDEVLSVGDEAFQQKSFERIQAIKAQGASILLVSHSMNVIKNMCQRAAWINHGELIALGDAKAVVAQYTGSVLENEADRLTLERNLVDVKLAQISTETPYRWGNRKVELTHIQITNHAGNDQTIFHTGQTLRLQIEYKAHELIHRPIFGVAIHRQDGTHITGPNTDQAGIDIPYIHGPGKICYEIANLPLLEGLYSFSVAVVDQYDKETFDYHDQLYSFRIVNQENHTKERFGILTLNGKWEINLPQLVEHK